MEEFDFLDAVDHGYSMDYEIEDLIPSEELRNGMAVLVENSLLLNLGNAKQGLYVEILKRNRWCTVTKLRDYGDEVVFIGIYADGTKQNRIHDKKYAWHVKLDSIPKVELPTFQCSFAHMGICSGIVKPFWEFNPVAAIRKQKNACEVHKGCLNYAQEDDGS